MVRIYHTGLRLVRRMGGEKTSHQGKPYQFITIAFHRILPGNKLPQSARIKGQPSIDVIGKTFFQEVFTPLVWGIFEGKQKVAHGNPSRAAFDELFFRRQNFKGIWKKETRKHGLVSLRSQRRVTYDALE